MAEQGSAERDALPITAQDDKAGQQNLWDRWWYDRFEVPNDIPDGARTCTVTAGDREFKIALLDHVAPKTCQAFWDVLPYEAPVIHCAWFGHAAYYLDRVDLPDVGYELENRSTKLAPGDWIWDPYIKEITFAYGRHAQVNFPTTVHMDGREHPNQVCIFARLLGDFDHFAAWCKSLRFEGTKPLRVTRDE